MHIQRKQILLRFDCKKIGKSAHAIYSNRWYLGMRRRNQNFERKFEISKKFPIDCYMLLVDEFCSCQFFQANNGVGVKQGNSSTTIYKLWKTNITIYHSMENFLLISNFLSKFWFRLRILRYQRFEFIAWADSRFFFIIGAQ